MAPENMTKKVSKNPFSYPVGIGSYPLVMGRSPLYKIPGNDLVIIIQGRIRGSFWQGQIYYLLQCNLTHHKEFTSY